MTMRVMPDFARPLVAELGLGWDRVEAGFARRRRLMDGDFITLEELYRGIFDDAGVAVTDAQLARIAEADRNSYLHQACNVRTLAFMQSLKARGFAIGILTNMPTSLAPDFRRVYADYVALSDAVVVSGEERLYKPMREIYDLLRDRIARPAGELCFFDDSEANCEGARAAGWRAIVFSSNDQAERDFEAMLAAEKGVE